MQIEMDLDKYDLASVWYPWWLHGKWNL